MTDLVRLAYFGDGVFLRSTTSKLAIVKHIAIFGGAIVLGLSFWPIANQYLPYSGLMIAIFLLGRFNRLYGYLVFAAFYCAGSSPLARATSTLLELALYQGVLVWLTFGAICSLPILLLRGKYPGIRAASVALLFVAPPFGYIAPNNPSILIGLFFPGLGMISILLFALLAATMGSVEQANRKAIAGFFALSVLSLGCNLNATTSEKSLPANWHALDTNFGKTGSDLARRMSVANLELPRQLKAAVSNSTSIQGKSIWFVAEGIVYDWSEATDTFWEEILMHTDATAVVGGYEFRDDAEEMISRVYVLGDAAARGEIRKQFAGAAASMTFPFAMWNPFQDIHSHFPIQKPSNVILVDGRRLHMSWCYESNLIWPHILASTQLPDVMVSIENRWISRGTSLEEAQSVAGILNARWLGVPLLRAVNH
jgi:hypothetical protein